MHPSKARPDRGLQHVPLPTACSLVHIEVNGKPPDPSADMIEILDDVAHALAILAPLYIRDSAYGLPREIPAHFLIGARFKRGAHVLVMRDKTEYRGLTIQRGDMHAAIHVLKDSGFRRRWHGSTSTDT